MFFHREIFLTHIKKDYREISLVFLLLLIVALLFVLASVPPVSRDALTHHLAVPKLLLRYGVFTEFPELDFSYYPMNLDLLYLVVLKFGNDIVPKYIHFVFALFTTLMIYRYLKARLGRIFGLLGCVFFLSIPVIVKLSVTVYVDLGLVFFSTSSLLLLFCWKEHEYRTKYLLLAGVCCGLAVGTKYNGLISLLLLTAFIPFFYIGNGENKSERQVPGAGYAVLFLVTALVFCSPWLIRNAIWTGNPFFPLFDTLFNPDNAFDAGVIENFAMRQILYKESFLQIVLLPFRVFFEGQDNNPQYFDGRLNPFLLILPFFSVFKTSKDRSFDFETKIMLLFSIFFVSLAFLKTGIRIRYIAPVLPFLVILSMVGLKNIYEYVGLVFRGHRKGNWGQYFIVTVVATLTLGYNYVYIVNLFYDIRPLQYLTGKESRNAFITRHHPEYSLIVEANTVLTDKDKILAIFLGNRGYYFDIPVKFDLQQQKSFFFETVKKSNSVNEISQYLHQQEVTHLFVRYDLFEKWVNDNLLQPERDRLNSFFKTRTVLMKGKQGHGLLRLTTN